MDGLVELTLEKFITALSGKSPTPGGGGASALVGAVGAALGNMVGALTLGKKKYADVEERVNWLIEQTTAVQLGLLTCIDRDAEEFEPLAKAYSIPKDDPTRAEVLENALHSACKVPYEIMIYCNAAIELLAEFAEKGSNLAVSDAGCGVILCKAAMQAAVLNIYINTKMMTNRECADRLELNAQNLLDKALPKADAVYDGVLAKLR
ncbi:MAG: cyclodeaminase/cyclohydrolase family protein [Oscillospiraceae bacterium]|jgi:formiminotetrahydrofolate cyclodeaminase|nr:cyclodeaminase/cyclohydrolase family protein [Oscillospiraceae bacterium]